MPVLNKDEKAKASRYLTTVTAALKAVANGDEDGALQSLQDMVDDTDTSFEDTLDATETLASLIAQADAEDDVDFEDEDLEEDDVEDEEVEETARLKTKASAQRKRRDTRAEFLDTAIASLEDEEDELDEEDEDEDFEEEEADADFDDEVDDEEVDEADEEDEEELVEESKVSKRVANRRASRTSTKASVAAPKAKAKAKADVKGRL